MSMILTKERVQHVFETLFIGSDRLTFDAAINLRTEIGVVRMLIGRDCPDQELLSVVDDAYRRADGLVERCIAAVKG